MKSTQNEKILQMKSETLIIGIDVGKENHYARSIDIRGLSKLNCCDSATVPKVLKAWITG